MQYELECGHCGFQFVLDVSELPRSAKCTVCGGVLTLAVPIEPLPVPKPPPARAPDHTPLPFPVPPLVDEVPIGRPRKLAEPWVTIRLWLNTARVATDFGRALCGVFLFFDLIVCSVGPRPNGLMWFPMMLGTALLLPGIVHIGSQVVLLQTPRTHGGDLAVASVGFLVLSVLLGLGLSKHNESGALTMAAVSALVAAGMWIEFLVRLGQSLRDDALVSAVRTYRVWFWFGLVPAGLFLVGAFIAEQNKLALLVWLGRAGVGAIVIVLLGKYSAVLDTAARAVARRAPAASDRS